MKFLCIAVVSTIVLCGCAARRDPTYALVRLTPVCERQGIRLTIVGDSLARGWGASAYKYAFASLIYAAVRAKSPKATLRNLGTPGATTDEIATSEVPRIPTGDCSLVVIISGANDAQKLYSPQHFESSYATLLQEMRVRTPHAALAVMGLPDISLSPRIPWVLKSVESWLSKDDDAAIGKAAIQYGAAFVPLYDLSHKEADRENSLLSRDGLHPNDAGYRIMADAALPSIVSLYSRDFASARP